MKKCCIFEKKNIGAGILYAALFLIFKKLRILNIWIYALELLCEIMGCNNVTLDLLLWAFWFHLLVILAQMHVFYK